jgi:putative inorganic carbon (HCO3(-)) transporter
VAGLGVQGLTDTIFFRPEVQLIGWFAMAVLAAGQAAAPGTPQTGSR